MNVLQIGKFYPILGGVEKVMWDLTIGLNASGVHCDMLCAKFSRDSVLEDDAEIVGEHLVCVRAWKKIAGTMIAPGMIFWLRKHRKKYDLVHIHHPDPMAALALFLSGYKGPVVLHWHSDIVSQHTLLELYLPLQKWLVRRACAIVGTTPVYISESPYLKGCNGKMHCVPIGIDPILPEVRQAEAIRKKYKGKYLILAIGRLVPYKGFDCLIDAIASLPRTYHLVLVGSGPLEEQLKAYAVRSNVAFRVSFMGHVSDSVLHSYLSACDVLAMTSSMKTEAFGIAQIEAFSCGKPVVSTRIPGSGVSWVNADGESGLTVPVGDDNAVAEAIRMICENPDLGRRLGEGAAERFNRLFTKESMVNEIVKIYEEQINC